jgi:transposase
MKQTTKYVGLDVHQATTVAVVGDETGRVIARSVVPTEATALLEFIRGMRGAVHVALEEGTQAQWLHDLLVGRVARVTVCDWRGEPRRGSKGDWHDAEWLTDRLRTGELRAVYHGSPHLATLRELGRAYRNLVEDATRVMSRLKALFRGRGIRTTGRGVYDPSERADWLAKLDGAGVRLRAATLYAELEVRRALRPTAKAAKAALVAEAGRDPAWGVLRTIPFLGPVRVALLLATLQTPWRFRTKRQLWAYAGLAVVTHTTSEYALDAGGRPVWRRRPPMTRGLNRNHNHVVKEVLKGAATVAAVRAGEFRDFYQALLARGMREELARVTLTRKLAALTLRLWKTGERYDARKLTTSHVVPAH